MLENKIENKMVNKIENKIEIDNSSLSQSGFPSNFNWEMHEENRRLKEENKEIVEKLKKKEKEILNLEEALTTLHEELKFLESQEVQSVAKDLAKKNRKLTMQLERERARASKLEFDA